MLLYGFIPQAEHHYSFAVSGLKIKSKTFSSRQSANEYMYKLLSKYKLHIRKVYDDKHYKTYICDNDVRFYIHRMY